MQYFRSCGVPNAGPSRKRKETTDSPYAAVATAQHFTAVPWGADTAAAALPPSFRKSGRPVSSNQLLAGYMAHEFLTRGTLLGRKWVPSLASAELGACGKHGSTSTTSPCEQPSGYAEVSRLLKNTQAHIPGIVNPTQLALWLQSGAHLPHDTSA